MKKSNNSEKPWVENYPQLEAWLNKHEACGMWEAVVGDIEEYPRGARIVRCYLFPRSARVTLVEVLGGGDGWNIWTDCADRKTESTFADAERRLGLAPGSEENSNT